MHGWTGIVAVSAGEDHTVGLKADGTVVITDPIEYSFISQSDVEGWTDIVAISPGSSHTVGLKADGTVVAEGYSIDGACDVNRWKKILVRQ